MTADPTLSRRQRLRQALWSVANDGAQQLQRAAAEGRRQLELRQAKSDLEAFWSRLGRLTYDHAKSGGDLDPSLLRAVARIDEMKAHLEALETSRTDEP
jgi:hypothetical protein